MAISNSVQLNILISAILCCLLLESITCFHVNKEDAVQHFDLTKKIKESISCSDEELQISAVQYCGNNSMRIAYPFWIRNTTNCSSRNGRNIWMEEFLLDCKEANGKVYLKGEYSVNSVAQVEVVQIRNDSTLVVDVSKLRKATYNCPNRPLVKGDVRFSTLSLKPYPGPLVMASDNMLLGWGCATAYLYTANLIPGAKQDYSSLIAADYQDYTGLYLQNSCSILKKDLNNSFCNGSACCTVPFPALSSTSATRYVWFDSSASLMYSSENPACSANASCNSTHPPFVSIFNPEFSDILRNVFRIRLRWAIPWIFSIDSSDYDPNLVNRQENEIKSAIRASADYACDPEHANLTLVDSVPGYLCSCNDGFSGDGYINGLGCVDVDECNDPKQNDCIPGTSTCHNLQGAYRCNCNSWMYTGDGRRNGTGCKVSPALVKSLAVIGGMLVLLLVCGTTITLLVIRHTRMTRRKHFVRHGGLQLEEYIANQGRVNTRKLFTEKELKVATNNFSDEMKLGSGGFGTVFKGILPDGSVVAIKMAHKKSWESESNDFANEMLILMQINHKHIVRLLGCCIETEVPLLVYEYVSNGTLAARLRPRRCKNVNNEGDQTTFQSESVVRSVILNVANVAKALYPVKKYVDQSPETELTIQSLSLSWEQRLKIARQIADALAYLHQAISPPIFHRDVKPENVLLDDMFDAKVADFGLSRLVMAAEKDGGKEMELHHQSSRAIQGTFGYIDPEYFLTLQFTSKSDVYSFGVMLVQLITGLKVIDHTREFFYIVQLFQHHIRQRTLHLIIDQCLQSKTNDRNRDESNIIQEKHHEEFSSNDDVSTCAANKLTLFSIMDTAKLASHCLHSVGSMRPSMREIAEKLTNVNKSSYNTTHHEQMGYESMYDSMLININSSPSTSGSHSQSLLKVESFQCYSGLSSSYSGNSNGQGYALTNPR